MTSSSIALLAITWCVAAYWMGWLTSYGFHIFRRFILTATQ